MVRHVVMWKLKENALGKTKAENMVELKRVLLDMKPKIKEILNIEVGINIEGLYADNSDVVLIADFAGVEELEIYQNHPDHEVVKAFVKEIKDPTAQRACVDYVM